MTDRTAAQRFDPLAAVAFLAAFVLPVAAIVVGHIALRQLRRGGAGRPLALAGTILGSLFTAAALAAAGFWIRQVLAQPGM